MPDNERIKTMTEPTKQQRYLHDFRFAGDLPTIPDAPKSTYELALIYEDFLGATALPPLSAKDLISDIKCNHTGAWLDSFLMCWEDIENDPDRWTKEEKIKSALAILKRRATN